MARPGAMPAIRHLVACQACRRMKQVNPAVLHNITEKMTAEGLACLGRSAPAGGVHPAAGDRRLCLAGVVVMNPLRALWRLFGSALLSVWLLLGLVGVLCCGYYLFEAEPLIYQPLNRLLLWDWIISYGWNALHDTWWFFAFLLLLGMLVANTLVCTWQKVAALIRRGPSGSRLDFVLRFSPHVMHLAFIVILASHLVTHVAGLNQQNNVVLLGKETTIPGSAIKLKLTGIRSDFYDGERLAFFKGRALTQDISLLLTEPGGEPVQKSLAYNSPIWSGGYSIHLKNYFPKAKRSMRRRPYANLIIRRDPGVKTFFAGTLVFAVGLLAYLWQALRQHRHRAAREVHP